MTMKLTSDAPQWTRLFGQQFIAGRMVAADDKRDRFYAANPASGDELHPPFYEASDADVEKAMRAAEAVFPAYRKMPAERRAAFLDKIADEIEAIGDELIERANNETGLGLERLRGERGRTTNQLRLFARVIREGSWVDARIDRGDPSRQPLPKPELRRMLVPLGPVVVFGASNFPLAFSAAGGDTASALAAGCPVVLKGHPAHPGTSELVVRAVLRAIDAAGVPAGVVSLLQGRTPELSLALVRHPATRAVGFTGSLKAGRALFDAAVARPDPIPVYAEMGSTNPVFILPGAMRERGDKIAEGLKASATLGTGQFCTKPGLVIGIDGEDTQRFAKKVGELIASAPAGTMLHAGICRAYEQGVQRLRAVEGVELLAEGTSVEEGKVRGRATVMRTTVENLLRNKALADEVFGPATVLVTGSSGEELEDVARSLEGHLTATVHGTPEDIAAFGDLIEILERKVGRLLFNGWPTGVEVGYATQHGGPYPATTDAHFTSVGTAAILRWARPLCYQNWPQPALPPELKDENPLNIWRTIDGTMTKDRLTP